MTLAFASILGMTMPKSVSMGTSVLGDDLSIVCLTVKPSSSCMIGQKVKNTITNPKKRSV
jgi:hypothetical protein